MEAYRASGQAKVDGVKTYLSDLLLEGSLPPNAKILLFALHKVHTMIRKRILCLPIYAYVIYFFLSCKQPVMNALDEFLKAKKIGFIRIGW